MTYTLTTNEMQQAQRQAKIKAQAFGKPVIAIYTSGVGIEIVSESFDVDRQYYHSHNGKKMFFHPILKAYPDGTIKGY